jgi:hypothetical protein
MKKIILVTFLLITAVYADYPNKYNQMTLKQMKANYNKVNNCVQKAKTLRKAQECSYPAPKSIFVKERNPEEEKAFQERVKKDQERLRKLILKNINGKF